VGRTIAISMTALQERGSCPVAAIGICWVWQTYPLFISSNSYTTQVRLAPVTARVRYGQFFKSLREGGCWPGRAGCLWWWSGVSFQKTNGIWMDTVLQAWGHRIRSCI